MGLILPFLLSLNVRKAVMVIIISMCSIVLFITGLSSSFEIAMKSAVYLILFQAACLSFVYFLGSFRSSKVQSQVVVGLILTFVTLSFFFAGDVVDSFGGLKEKQWVIQNLLLVNPFLVGCSLINEPIFTKPHMYRIFSDAHDYGWRYPEWYEPILFLLVLSCILVCLGYVIRKIFKTGYLASNR